MCKKIIALVFGCLIAISACSNRVYDSIGDVFFNEDVKTILFLGDSITYAGDYVNYIEAYLALSFPDGDYEIINVGLPSETVSGLSEENHADGAFPRPVLFERLERVLRHTKPDFVFTNYGINDGIYKPFDQKRFQDYQEGMLLLDKRLREMNLPVIHITPPVFDGKQDPAYADVIHTYANWLLAQRKAQNWLVIDAHWPMQEFLTVQRLKNSDFYLAKDGIHPNKVGHGIIADSVLQYLGIDLEHVVIPGDERFNKISKGKEVLELVRQKQSVMKDAWLTNTGHLRPRMKTGLPMNEAKLKENIFNKQIAALTE